VDIQAEDKTGELTGGQMNKWMCKDVDRYMDRQLYTRTDEQSERAINKPQENEGIYVSISDIHFYEPFSTLIKVLSSKSACAFSLF
jgi:hypothetical protein